MVLLKVNINGKPHLLHNGECFIGVNHPDDLERVALENSAKIVSCGGYEPVTVNSDKELLDMIGGVRPYKILNVSGGLIPFYAVEIVEKK